ncbi:MAG: hypothetical protein RL607_2196 [Bacteroidota bacterium]|jgi:phospholipid/cholesterol/gamma-HCH transport system substrate-binding protein
MKTTNQRNWRLGIFSFLGLTLLVVTIYILGFNQNLFRSSFVLYARFSNVSGLKQGSTVRLSGINVGTVARIEFVSDSLVLVKIWIDKEIQPFIKTDAMAAIGGEGLVGDKVLEIIGGDRKKPAIRNNDTIESVAPIQWETLMKSVSKSAQNAEVITAEWSLFSKHLNQDNGLVYQLIHNESMAQSMHKIVANLERSTHELAQFTPTLNNKSGPINHLLTDEEWSKQLSLTLLNIQATSQEWDTFSQRLNRETGLLHQLITNDSLQKTVTHTLQEFDKTATYLREFAQQINQPNTVLSKLTNDPKLGQQLDSTAQQLDQSIREFRELEKAAKASFLLRGYFKKNK